MRYAPIGILLLPTFLLVACDDNSTTTTAEGLRKTDSFLRPDFSPYCADRDACASACDCAVYENCQNVDMNADVRSTILNALNEARSARTQAEPKASGMTMLNYDHDLEDVSQCWTARCENDVTDCFVTPYYNGTSQAVGVLQVDAKLSEIPLDYWYKMVQTWLGEADNATSAEKPRERDQVLSDEVTHVGCSWSQTAGSLVFACTFAPRGPGRGQAVYKTGKACADCPDGYRCDFREPYELLCKETAQMLGVGEETKRELGRAAFDEEDFSKRPPAVRSPDTSSGGALRGSLAAVLFVFLVVFSQ